MCLITEQKEPFIAEEDIICYKTGYRNKKFLRRTYFVSLCIMFRYRLNKIYKTDLELDTDIGNYWDGIVADHYGLNRVIETSNLISVIKGFHSFATLDRIQGSQLCTVQCIIPKGSEYYADATGLLCSNQIIIKKILD